MARRLRSFWVDKGGQDLVEYALMCGLICAGSAVLMPITVVDSMCRIYSRISSVLVTLGGAS